MKTRIRLPMLFLLPLLCAALLCAACGDDDDATGDAGSDADTDTDTDTDADTSGEDSLTVVVNGGVCAPAALEGALVTLDAPGGARLQATADATGTAVFTGLNFALGTAAVTASVDGYPMVTRTGIASGAEPVEILIVIPDETVALSGAATNMADEDHQLLVNETACGSGYSQKVGPGYDTTVTPGRPFSLFGLEFSAEYVPSGQGVTQTFYNWFWQEMDAIEADTTYDITFGTSLAPATASGSFDPELPEWSPLAGDQGYGYMQVGTFPDNWVMGVGWPTSIDIAPDGGVFDYEVAYLDGEEIVNPVTDYYVYSKDGSTAAWCMVREAGFPPGGVHAPGFIEYPVLAPGTGADGAYVLPNGTFSWTSGDDDVYPTLVVTLGTMGTVWEITGPPGATSLTVPAPPEGAEMTGYIESYPQLLDGYLTLWRPGEGELDGIWYADLTQTDALPLQLE